MNSEIQNKRTKGYLIMRSVMDYTMGVLYIAVGGFMIFPEKLGFAMEGFDQTFRYIFGGICFIYGGWRIYRGVKKEYYNNEA